MLREDLSLLYGVIPERSFGREKLDPFPSPSRIDQVDKVDSNMRECLGIATSCQRSVAMVR